MLYIIWQQFKNDWEGIDLSKHWRISPNALRLIQHMLHHITDEDWFGTELKIMIRLLKILQMQSNWTLIIQCTGITEDAAFETWVILRLLWKISTKLLNLIRLIQ